MSLSSDELQRYSRHLILPEVGQEGQKKLKNSSVLVVGAGGLGCPLLTYLAAAGVGRLGLIDFDVVDVSNLQRQVLYATSDVGKPKVDVAKRKILDLNPEIKVETYQEPLTSANALELFAKYDVIADGTDNFATRYLVNDACVLSGKPNVYGSIFRFEGQITVFNYKNGPNYRCLYKEPPPPGLVPSCAEGGVLGVLPGVVATLQATEVIKVLLDIEEAMKSEEQELEKKVDETDIEKEFGELLDPNDPCSFNKIAIQTNITNIKQQDLGEDDDYDPFG